MLLSKKKTDQLSAINATTRLSAMVNTISSFVRMNTGELLVQAHIAWVEGQMEGFLHGFIVVKLNKKILK